MRTTVFWGVAAALVSGMLLVTGGQTAERPLMRDLELEALQEAVRWPKPDVSTVLALVGRFVAAGRDQEGYAYFQGRTRDAPDRPLPLGGPITVVERARLLAQPGQLVVRPQRLEKRHMREGANHADL